MTVPIHGGVILSEDIPAGENLFTYAQVAERLGVKRDSVRVAANSQRITRVGSGPSARIPESEVIKWEKRFSRLNDAFAWLKPVLEEAGGKVATISPPTAAKSLGCTSDAVHEWCRSGLLPFFVRSFSTGPTMVHLAVVQTYVEGLVKSAWGIPVLKHDAVTYFESCRANKRIM